MSAPDDDLGYELVDADHDGEPDTEHAPWPRAVERDEDDEPPQPGALVRWREGRRESRAARAALPVEPPVLPRQLVEAAGHRVPSRARVAAISRTYGPVVAWAVVWSPIRLPWWLLRQLGAAGRGIGVVMATRRVWIKQPEARAGLRAEGIDPTRREELRAQVEQREAGRRRSSILAAGTLTVALTAVTVWQVWLGVTLAAAGLLALVLLGRQPRDEGTEDNPVRISPIRAGMTLGSLGRSVTEVALAMDIDDVRTRNPRPFITGEGFSLQVQTTDALEPRTLREFERRLGVPAGSIMLIVDSEDSSVRTLRITLSDPLANPAGRDDPEFDSISVREPVVLGRTADGSLYRETFMRSHVQLVGVTRSGKSSALWRFLRILAGWRDARAVGIDLVKGPAFSALRGVLDRRAFDYEAAVELLTEMQTVANDRIVRLGKMAEDDDPDLDDADENHVPTADEPQWFVVIDEFNALVAASRAEAAESGDKSGLGSALVLVEWLLRYAGKAAVNLVLSGQGSKATDVGTTTIREQVTINILFACSRDDVLRTLGKDARDDGYRPDRLQPAQGDEVRDAGKCYTISAVNSDPNVRRVFRYSLGEVRKFAREYRAWLGQGGDGTEAEAAVIPAVLMLLSDAFEAFGHDRISSARIVTHANRGGGSWTQASLAEAVKPYRLATRKERSPADPDRSVQCYRRADVDKAIGRLVGD